MEFKAVRLELAKTTIIVDAETQSKTIAIMAEGKDTEKNALLFENAPEILEILKYFTDFPDDDFKEFNYKDMFEMTVMVHKIAEAKELIRKLTYEPNK